MHDLVGLYAGQLGDECAKADGREQARARLLRYYVDTAAAADADLRALRGMAAPGPFAGREEAMAWLDREQANLNAAAQIAATTGHESAAMLLPLVLAEYRVWQRRFDESLATTAVSPDASGQEGQRREEPDFRATQGPAVTAAPRPSVGALVARARTGDEQAWNEIVERYAPLVWVICARYQLSHQDADDVGQSVWLLLIENIGDIRDPAALAGWLATTTERKCRRLLRFARRHDHTDRRSL